MRPVFLAGVGSTNFGRLSGRSIKDLAREAGEAALLDSGIPRERIGALLVGNFLSGALTGQEVLAPLIANELGLRQVEPTKVEGACASSAIAFRLGFQMVGAGIHDAVLVVGVEKMTEATAEQATKAIMAATDLETEGRVGLTFPSFWGLVMSRHAYEYGTTREQVALVSVKNRRNGVLNEKAQFRSPVTVESVLHSRSICDPILLYDCCPISDGAAAAVICSRELVGFSRDRPTIEVVASAQTCGPVRTVDFEDITTFPGTVEAAQRAYRMAGIGPKDIDVVELHDCFTMAEIVDSEDLGFFPKGEGGRAVELGLTAVDGPIPINPSGGLLSKGHPVGATGCGQIYEIALQLWGRHPNQVPGARVGLTHNAGGTGTVTTVHIFRRTN
jgi:acetyl-CoA C-acetyltransferase